jgi:hypothetical protein
MSSGSRRALLVSVALLLPATGYAQQTVDIFAGGAAVSTGIGLATGGNPVRVTLATDDNAQAALSAIQTATENTSATLADMNTRLSIDADTDNTALTKGPQIQALAQDFDGGAFPSPVSAEGDAVRPACSLYGVCYSMLVSEDGSLQYGTTTTPFVTGGNVAHDGVDAGNPSKIGARATTSVSGETKVASADRTNLYAGIDGVMIVRPNANLEDRVSGVAAVTDGSSTSVVAAQGSGVRFCATTVIISNSSATNVTVDIRDGTAGSVIATIPAAANMGGAAIPLSTPLCGTANTAMAADPSASASTVTTTLIGFKTAL